MQQPQRSFPFRLAAGAVLLILLPYAVNLLAYFTATPIKDHFGGVGEAIAAAITSDWLTQVGPTVIGVVAVLGLYAWARTAPVKVVEVPGPTRIVKMDEPKPRVEKYRGAYWEIADGWPRPLCPKPAHSQRQLSFEDCSSLNGTNYVRKLTDRDNVGNPYSGYLRCPGFGKAGPHVLRDVTWEHSYDVIQKEVRDRMR
jgi:hypothetical protein